MVRDPTPDPVEWRDHQPVYECGGCGDEIYLENHRVKNGEAFCQDCEPLEVGKGLPSPDFEPPQTIEEYEANRSVLVHVGELMDGGQVR